MKKAIILLLSLSCLAGCSSSSVEISPSQELIQPDDNDESEEAWIDQDLDAFLNDGESLPGKSEKGSLLTWSVVSGQAEIKDNVIHKTEDAAEYEPVVLSVQCDGNTYTYDHLMLLDPYAAYVMSYFTSDGSDAEKLKLAYTYDSLYWFKLNDDHSILTPKTGTRRLRDPSIVRKKDGSFALLATQGYDNPSIYAFDSTDLIHYENERLLRVASSSKTVSLSEKEAWAPEAFYDRTIDRYVIYWSSSEDGGMFMNTSSDLKAFSDPFPLLDAGFDVIDGTFVKNGHEWTIILKDERQPMEEYSQLFVGNGSYWNRIDAFSSPIYSRHQVEGPMVMKALQKEGWYIYCDDYTRGQYKVLYTDDIAHGPYEEVSDSDLMIPMEKPAHGYAIPVTWKELSRLIDVYDR